MSEGGSIVFGAFFVVLGTLVATLGGRRRDGKPNYAVLKNRFLGVVMLGCGAAMVVLAIVSG